MPSINHGGVTVDVDNDGFMVNPELWDEQVAAALATTEGITELSEDHWQLVK